MGLSAERLDHWTLVTSNLARTQKFYTEVLDAEPLKRAHPAGVTFGGTIIDFFLPEDGGEPSPGIDHHAYSIALDDFDAWAEQLRDNGVEVRFANFARTGMSMLFDDPDGYHFELVVSMGSEEITKVELEKRGIESNRRRN
jgi:catechol 2,3-dioxygenase-like lactoylglutathione lyase family enzyme